MRVCKCARARWRRAAAARHRRWLVSEVGMIETMVGSSFTVERAPSGNCGDATRSRGHHEQMKCEQRASPIVLSLALLAAWRFFGQNGKAWAERTACSAERTVMTFACIAC